MKVTSGPTFSLVVAVLNGASTIQRCLQSVADQTCLARELIVIDGGSTDGTQQILSTSGAAISYWESKPDRGISHAWNKAIGHATGEWVLFLGADDELATADVLERALENLRMDDKVAVAYGAVTMERVAGRPGRIVGSDWDQMGRDFFHHNTLPHQAVFHRRSMFDRVGEFDESFRICADYDLLLRELKARPPLYLPGLVVTRMGRDGVSQRPENGYRGTLEQVRALRANGLFGLPLWLSPRIWRSTAFEAIRRTFGVNVARRVAARYKRAIGMSTEAPD
jgi:glycosyltransferase involved in cell wall biosynthesis